MTKISIDAGDNDLRRVVTALRKAADEDDGGGRLTTFAAACRTVARQIEEQTPRPRMPEPREVGSVVLAGCVHGRVDTRFLWTRGADGNWYPLPGQTFPNGQPITTTRPDDWDSLTDPAKS